MMQLLEETMMRIVTWSAVLCILTRMSEVQGRRFTHHVSFIKDKYDMWWHFNEEEITFKVKVATTGWIGWGLSQNGNMRGSDMVIGWVSDNGVVHFDDRHGVGNHEPPIDKRDDYTLLEMSEDKTAGTTTMVFKRKLKLCSDDDKDITENTVSVMYAFNDQDPVGGVIRKHSYRGSKSVLLLNYGDAIDIDAKLPTSYETFTIGIENFTVPKNDTVYLCKTFKLPSMVGKRHIVRIDPVIAKGNEPYVHHMLMFFCTDIDERSIGTEHDCLSPNMPDDLKSGCRTNPVFSWGIGGTEFYLPEEAGFPFLETNSGSMYALIEMHYDNPSLVEGVIDNSGIKVYHTSVLRKYDAGILATGVMPAGLPETKAYYLSQIIPPQLSKFTTHGYCSSKCISVGENSVRPTVFAVRLHTHAGRKIKAMIVRDSDGAETQTIAQDMNFDFNYQDYRYLAKPLVIPPKHSVHVKCEYNSTKYNNPVVSGFRTSDEMCLAFLYHYPQLNNRLCTSLTTGFKGWAQKQFKWNIGSPPNFKLLPSRYINGSRVDYLMDALRMKEFWSGLNKDQIESFEEAGVMDKQTKVCTYYDKSMKPAFIVEEAHKPVTELNDGHCSGGMSHRISIFAILQLLCVTFLIHYKTIENS